MNIFENFKAIEKELLIELDKVRAERENVALGGGASRLSGLSCWGLAKLWKLVQCGQRASTHDRGFFYINI